MADESEEVGLKVTIDLISGDRVVIDSLPAEATIGGLRQILHSIRSPPPRYTYEFMLGNQVLQESVKIQPFCQLNCGTISTTTLSAILVPCALYQKLGLHAELVQALSSKGWRSTPGPLEAVIVEPLANSHDVIGLSPVKAYRYSAIVLSALQTASDNSHVLVDTDSSASAVELYSCALPVAAMMDVKCVKIMNDEPIELNALRSLQVVAFAGVEHARIFLLHEPKFASSIRLCVVDSSSVFFKQPFRDIFYDTFKMLWSEVQVFLVSACVSQELTTYTPKFMRNLVTLKPEVLYQDLGLHVALREALLSNGWRSTPTPLEAVVVESLANLNDVIGLSLVKEHRYSAIILSALQYVSDNNRVLVVTDSSTSAVELHDIAIPVAAKMDVKCVKIVNSEPIEPNALRSLHVVAFADVEVLRNCWLYEPNFASSIRLCVVDSSSAFWKQPFLDFFYDIFKSLSPEVQVFLVSADMSPDIVNYTPRFMRNPTVLEPGA